MAVRTPLGKGWVVHEFPDGTIAVELQHGGGSIFHPEEIFTIPGEEGPLSRGLAWPTPKPKPERIGSLPRC